MKLNMKETTLRDETTHERNYTERDILTRFLTAGFFLLLLLIQVYREDINFFPNFLGDIRSWLFFASSFLQTFLYLIFLQLKICAYENVGLIWWGLSQAK